MSGSVAGTPPAFTLRDATPADTAHVLRLVRGLAEYERALHLVTADEEQIEKLLFGPKPFAYAALAEADGQTVGVLIWYYTIGTFRARLGLFVEDVFVEPAYRGKGIGLALFRHAAAVARDEGCEVIEWRVLNWNRPAINFYRKLGAQPITEWQTMQLRGDALRELGAKNG